MENLQYKGKWVFNWFSNMLPLDTSFLYQGIEYKTVENFYQAMKLPKDKLSLRKEISELSSQKAKKEIRNKEKYLWREDWNKEMALSVMEYALRIKFSKDTSWYKKLITTKGEIVEWNNWGDVFWGKTLDGKGENHLGKILMKIRDEANLI